MADHVTQVGLKTCVSSLLMSNSNGADGKMCFSLNELT